MLKKNFYLYYVLIFLAGINFCFSAFGSNKVFLRGRQLFVQGMSFDGELHAPQGYVIYGLTWSPATRAPDSGPNPFFYSETVDYGFFFDWPGRNPKGYELFNYWIKTEFLKYYRQDIALMKKMNINTVRVYNDFGDNYQVYKDILDEFYRNGIMVIMNVAASKEDIDSKRYKRVVQFCKDHPAILFWSIGNEWNLDYNKYWGYDDIQEAAQATDRVAYQVKLLDKNHPVSSILGDRFDDQNPKNTISWIVNNCTNVDIWGINVYRGRSFNGIFTQWDKITDKPMFLSEFGVDSYQTVSYKILDEYKADNCMGFIDEDKQVDYDINLWNELLNNLSFFDVDKNCLGGIIHSFNDSLWKVGSYHVSLGGLVDYYNPQQMYSYKSYNPEGFILSGGMPDGVANEEYFGVVDADRRPKKIYFELQKYFTNLKQAIINQSRPEF